MTHRKQMRPTRISADRLAAEAVTRVALAISQGSPPGATKRAHSLSGSCTAAGLGTNALSVAATSTISLSIV